jgi:hypothetical protein
MKRRPIKLAHGDRVREQDTNRIGKIIRAGDEVSEVLFNCGTVQFITNKYLIRI